MKSTKYILIAAAAMTLAACSSENEPVAQGNGEAAKVFAGIGAVQSRATGTDWDANDIIGISGTSDDARTTFTNVAHKTVNGDGNFIPANKGIYFKGPAEVTFNAYYPYDTNGGTVTASTTDQTPAKQKSFDFLWAEGAKASRANPTLSFTGANAFAHKMTRLVINIVTDPNAGFEAEDVTTGTYYLNGLKHEGSFDTTTGETGATGAAVADWQISATPSDNNNVRTYDMILFPQTLSEALEFKGVIDGQTFVNGTSIKPDLKAGTSYSYTITLKKTGLVVSSCTINDWTPGTPGSGDAGMELPKPDTTN